jgi:hypothetical protein
MFFLFYHEKRKCCLTHGKKHFFFLTYKAKAVLVLKSHATETGCKVHTFTTSALARSRWLYDLATSHHHHLDRGLDGYQLVWTWWHSAISGDHTLHPVTLLSPVFFVMRIMFTNITDISKRAYGRQNQCTYMV